MPQYGKPPFNISVYPGQNGFAFGWPAKGPGAPASQISQQYESITTGEKSVPISVSPSTANRGYTQRQITWQTGFSLQASAIDLVLQGAIEDVDASYATVDTSTSVTGEVRTVASNFRFFRILAVTVTGTCDAAVQITAM